MNRRHFLKVTTISSAAASLDYIARAVNQPSTKSRKLILSAPLTHSDWMLKPNVAWGPEGVHHMLEACRECGWSRIYWRVLDGGRALYKSKLLSPMGRWDDNSFWNPKTDPDREAVRRFNPNMTEAQRAELLKKFDRLDYSKFDPFAEAIRYGHKIGLEVHAWVSINEDDHGWGLQSDFSRKHPEFRWHGRNDKVYHSQLSFAFPEVRRYKLAILEELLSNYELDGIFLDWIRTGDVRDNPQNDTHGVADYGYEKPLMEQWRKEMPRRTVNTEDFPANDDESWIRMRAVPQIEFMRAARKLVKSRKPKLPISALVAHPWHYRSLGDKIDGNLRGLLLDVPTWSREGLVDAIVAAGYYRDGGNVESAWHALWTETAGQVDVWTYAWVPNSVVEAQESFALAEKLGARQILFWEADYIDDRKDATALKAAMRGRAEAA